MKTTATKRAKVAAAKDLPVNISHPDKVFWPEDGYTKGDLAEFYAINISEARALCERPLADPRAMPGRNGRPVFLSEGNAQRHAGKNSHEAN